MDFYDIKYIGRIDGYYQNLTEALNAFFKKIEDDIEKENNIKIKKYSKKEDKWDLKYLKNGELL